MAYLLFIIVTALCGNALLMAVIFKKNLLQKVCYYFILSLSTSDFLNALLKMPVTVLGRFDRRWYPSNTICYFTTPLGVLFGAASVFSLSAVAINRFLVISSPLSYSDRMPPRLAKIIVGAIWMGSIALAIPPVLWRSSREICYSGAISAQHYTSEMLYLFLALWLFVVVIPSITMSLSYVKIFLIARYHALQIDSQNQASMLLNQLQSKRRRKDVKAACVLAVIGGIFLVCWIPFFVVQTAHKFRKGIIDPVYFHIFLCLMYSNSALDPILLFSFNAEIKRALVMLLCKTLIRSRNQKGGIEVSMSHSNQHRASKQASETISTQLTQSRANTETD